MSEQTLIHKKLPCGIELAGESLPGRQVASVELRILAGAANDLPDRLGVAQLVAETAGKGTKHYDMVALADEFDRIGAQNWESAGIEAMSFGATVLPEHLSRAIELCAEMICHPVFPDEQTAVQIELARQGLQAMEDEPTRKMYALLGQKAWGDPLGRIALGDLASLDTTGPEDLKAYWKRHFRAANMQVVVAGAFDEAAVCAKIDEVFGEFGGDATPEAGSFVRDFTEGRTHIEKDCEQQQLGVAFPALAPDHDDAYVQSLVSAILSGGMSARLFTEIREKRGLAYWVRAGIGLHRGAGVFTLGAGTTPDRAHETLEVLLSEVNRLGGDVTEDELRRAKIGQIASMSTRGDSTRARAGSVSGNLFYRGRPVTMAERREKIDAVTTSDIKRYLDENPRSPLCVMTLGPRPLEA